MSKEKILVVGSLNMDFVAYVDNMPAAGETVLAGAFDMVHGGKGANQAFAVGRLGGRAAMVGAVGDDEYGRALIDGLEAAGVDAGAVLVVKGAATGRAHITVDKIGNNSIVVIPGANYLLTPALIEGCTQLLDESDIVMLQLEIPLETVCYMAKLAKARGKRVILDPAPAVRGLPPELLRRVDIIKPNEIELGILTGINTDSPEGPESAARSLLESGVGAVVVTAGAKGALLVDSGGCSQYPAKPVSVVDTTAAGDSFAAALACALSGGMGLPYAIRLANAVSSVVVTKKGAQSSIPTMDEVIAQGI